MNLISLIKLICSLLAAFFTGYLPAYFLFECKKGCLKENKENSDDGGNTNQGIIDSHQPDEPAAFPGFYRKNGFNGRHNISKQFFIFFISIYFGFFIISNYLILLSLFKVKFSFLNAAVFSLIFFTAFIFIQILKFYKGKHEETKGGKKEKTGKLSLSLQAFFSFLIFINLCVVTFFTFLFPIRFWDAISCWSFKGRAFFLDGSVAAFYTQHQYTFTHPTYPLYISLSQTWIYLWLGEINETLVKVIFPLFYLSLIFIVYSLLRKEVKRLYAIVSVFILSTLPVIMDHGYLEYTNLIFSIILLLGVYYFYIYISKNRENQKKDNLKNLIISSVFFAILASIRSEGILFIVIFLIINTAYNLSALSGSPSPKRRNTILIALISILLPAALIFLLLVPWTILQAKLNISGASTEWVPVIEGLKNGLNSILSSSLPGSLKEIFNAGITGSLSLPGGLENSLNGNTAGGFGEISRVFDFKNATGAFLGEFLFSRFDSVRAFLGSSYGISWIILAVMAVFNFKKLFRAFNWIFFVFLFTGFIVLFMSLGFIAEFAWSTERYMLHLFPLAYFWIMRSYLFNTVSLKSLAPEK